MITFYCPACWQSIPEGTRYCPFCGFEISQDAAHSFEEKLLGALKHPIQEKRLLAIQILGELKSETALPEFERLLQQPGVEVYEARETLVALSKIQSPRSLELIRAACRHPYPLIRRLAARSLSGQFPADQAVLEQDGSMEAQVTQIVLVRHGQTEWNRIERFRGRADVPLNETGLKQAEATGRWVAQKWQPSAVYSSPLSRAVKTAEAIARPLGLLVQIEADLVDIDYGEWQGLTPEEAARRWPEQVDHWYNRPERARIPGGETLEALRERAMRMVSRLVEAHPDQTIVLVGHTVINRIILLGMLGLGNERFWRIRQEPCAINVILAEAGDFTLVSLNDTCHLNG